MLAFLLARCPTAWHAPASQDEEWYGVPGLTVAREGIPRVPYCRAREEGSVFNGAEQILFAQPPLSFYVQSPFFAVLPPGYGAARVSSLAAACLAIVLVFAIGRHLTGDDRVALIAAGLFSFSRLLFFPAISSRPDMLCGTLGLVAIWCTSRLAAKPLLSAVTSGIALGLAGLTHPFAIVFAAQVGVWHLIRSGTLTQRCLRCSLLIVAAALTFMLWLPLIAMSSDLFREQFVGNILRPAGPGLLTRFVMPAESFANQIPQLFLRANPIQFALLAIGIVTCGVFAISKRDRTASLLFLIASTGVYLLVVCVGIHPIQGFWCYPAAFGWTCVAYATVRAFDTFKISGAMRVAMLAGLIAALIPGSGLRATWTYVANWNDTNYASRIFVQDILREIPEDVTLTVGREFALDAYGNGRDIILACQHPMYFDSTKFPTQRIIVGRRDHEAQIIEGYQAAGFQLQRMKTFGDPQDSLACYAELWSIRLD